MNTENMFVILSYTNRIQWTLLCLNYIGSFILTGNGNWALVHQTFASPNSPDIKHIGQDDN